MFPGSNGLHFSKNLQKILEGIQLAHKTAVGVWPEKVGLPTDGGQRNSAFYQPSLFWLVQFSDPLINTAIRVFKDEHGILLSHEEANVVLDSFADLYLAFARGGETGTACALARTGPLAAAILDSTYTSQLV